MVNVTVIIFFGKSEKNIWVLDFFNYNHWYRISKTDLFMEQYYSRNSRPDITAKHLEQYHSQSMEQQNRYNSYHSYNVEQLSQIKQDNRATAKYYFCKYGVTSWQNGK